MAFGAFMTIYRTRFSLYLQFYFRSEFFFKAVRRNLGATINSINNKDLKKFKVLLPNELEQTAIAQVLTKADEEINQTQNYLQQLQEQKKGLMQQLLTGQKRVTV